MLCGATGLSAQNAGPQGKRLTAVDGTSLRFWDMYPQEGKLLSLVSRRGDNIDPVLSNFRPFDIGVYIAFKPKTYTLRLQDEQGKILAETSFEGKKGCYFTAVAEPDGQGVRLRMIDDTYQYISGGQSHVTVHQFVPGGKATIALGEGKEQTILQGQNVSFDGVKNGTALHIKVTAPQGPAIDSETTVDLSKDGNRMSYLIILDRYGRIVIRTATDGYFYAPIDQDLLPSPTPSSGQETSPSPTPSP